jgi:hypothetical protein
MDKISKYLQPILEAHSTMKIMFDLKCQTKGNEILESLLLDVSMYGIYTNIFGSTDRK